MVIHIDILTLAVVLTCFFALNRKLKLLQISVSGSNRKLYQDSPIPEGYEVCDGAEIGYCFGCEARVAEKELLYNKEKDRYYHRHCLPQGDLQ
jgi:hypothetical protein